jgi:hypothetical protein
MKLEPIRTLPMSALPAMSAGLLAFVLGCNRTQPAEPPTFDAGPLHMTLSQALGLAAGSEKPAPPEPPTDANFVKVGKRDIDWDLDASDPASDYVERYIQATQRYGTERKCVHAQPSRIENGRPLVDARDTPAVDRASQGAGAPPNGCNGTGAVRDTFAVDVDHDHLELADPARGTPLADWPDGSSPGGMPTASPKEGPAIEGWKSPLPKALQTLALVPLRVQFYGRGSYPLLSVAGWHGMLTLTSSPDELATDAKKICEASAAFPVGIIATMDRSIVLRVKCPAGAAAVARWEHL